MMSRPGIPRTMKLRRPLKFVLPFLFIATLVLVLLSGVSQPAIAQLFVPSTPPTIVRPEIRGVWMTNIDSDVLRDRASLKSAVTKLAQANFNTIYPVMWNSGYVLYPSEVAKRAGAEIHSGYDDGNNLTRLVEYGHQQGLRVIPWFEFGTKVPITSELALNHPDWLTEKRNGEQGWVGPEGENGLLNPFHPEVQQFITSLVLEAIAQTGADGIQFDDHFCLPVEFGYDAFTKKLYQKENQGKMPPNNPNDPAWMKWRADKFTEFMARLNKAIKAQNSRSIVSVSPNPYEHAYNAYLQDWVTWQRRGLMDELIVQVYRTDMNNFLSHINRPEIQEAQKKIPTGIGILSGLKGRPTPMSLVQSQIQASRSRGLGVSFFFYESLWNFGPEVASDRHTAFARLLQ